MKLLPLSLIISFLFFSTAHIISIKASNSGFEKKIATYWSLYHDIGASHQQAKIHCPDTPFTIFVINNLLNATIIPLLVRDEQTGLAQHKNL